MIIKARKFILRPIRNGDEKSLIENINDKSIYRYTCSIPHPYTKKHAREFINLVKQKRKDEIHLSIDLDGKIVGGIGLIKIKKHRAEIGYWLGKNYWNKGIISEAIRLVSDFGFNKLKLKRIQALVFPQNKASSRVLEKNGYKLEGVLKKYAMKDGKVLNDLLYAKTK